MIVEIYISNDSGTVTFSSEIVTVKSGIGIEEKASIGMTPELFRLEPCSFYLPSCIE